MNCVHLIVIQPTSFCNLNCRYCYVPNRRDTAMISDTVLEAAISKALNSPVIQKKVEFLFHAGEPLVAGKAFYERVSDLVELHNVKPIHVTKAIQTNATLIDDEWCELFKRKGYHLGVSIDGPAAIHDGHRKDWAGRGSFTKVMRGIQRLNEHKLTFGAICVLSRESLAHPDEMFQFFSENGFQSVGFNIEEVESANKSSSMISADPIETARIEREFRLFMSRFLELWEQSGRKLKVREFFEMALFILKKQERVESRRVPDETADLGIITIQKNGDMSPYSPEFAGSPSEYYENFVVGNILQTSYEAILDTVNFRKIQRDIHRSLSMCAESCKYFDLCGGAFLSNKFWQNGSLFSTETATCRLTRQTIADLVIEKWAKAPEFG